MQPRKILTVIRPMAIILLSAAAIYAQVPTPTPPLPPVTSNEALTLAGMLEGMMTNFVAFKNAFIATVEGTLGGYFAVLAYMTAWIVAVFYFSQQFFRGEWDLAEVGQYTGRIIVCLLLLIFCGDVDNDGKRGDLVRFPAYLGYWLAHGQTAETPEGSLISRKVEEEQNRFNTNYDTFIENKLMVKINDRDMPIRYPGMQGIQTVAAVYTGQGTAQQQKQAESQEFWIGLQFQLLNFCRSIIALLDFFLVTLYSFGILVMSLVAPFMVCGYVNRDLAKRFTEPFLWTVFTMTIVFPFLAQVARYFAYLTGNLALGTGGNPIYTFDATTNTITANGDPTPMILLAVLCMLVSILFLAMSVVLSYSLVQGKLVESMSGLIANAFAGISTVGLTAAVSTYSTKLQTAGEKAQIEGSYNAATTQADYSLEAQKESAKAAQQANAINADAGYGSTMVNAGAQRKSSEQIATGQFLGGLANTQAENFQTVNNAWAGLRHNLKTMGAEQKKEYATNMVEMLRQNDDATSQRLAKEIEMYPDKASLLAEQYMNFIEGVPIGGTALKSLGVTKEGLDSWMRTPGNTAVGKTLFGNPENLQGGMYGKTLEAIGGTTVMQEKNKDLENDFKPAQGLVFQRADGTMVDAVTGIKLNPDGSPANMPTNPQLTATKDGFPVPKRGGNQAKTTTAGNTVPGAKKQGIPTSQTPSYQMPQISGGIPKMTKKQRENYAAMQQLNREDPNFLPTLQRESWKRGLDPNNVLNMLAIESGFRKNALNSHGYLGLGQVGSKERLSIGRGWTGNGQTDLARVRGMSASQQLETLVFPFIDQKFGRNTNGLTMDKMYAGWGSGHFRNDPNYVHMEKGGKRATAYANNPQWDWNKDGKVEQWEFGNSAYKNLGAGIYFDANKALGQMRAVDPPTARFLAKKYSADSTYQNTLANNRQNFENKNMVAGQYYAEKAGIETDYTQEQIDIANRKAGIQMGGLEQVRDYQIAAANTVYAGQSRAAEINRAGTLGAGQVTYDGSIASAGLQYKGQVKAAEITREASLEALYQRNMASLVQSVGNVTAHQISELFERASKGL